MNKLAKDKAQKQQVQAAKSRFMGLLQEYQTVEKEFRKKVKERGERQYKIGELSVESYRGWALMRVQLNPMLHQRKSNRSSNPKTRKYSLRQ